jgi:hypothetical protein
MTDPRAAALAEALHGIHGGGPCFTRYRDCGVQAAAILAALPPDWCWHASPKPAPLAEALHATGLNSIGHKPGHHGRFTPACICNGDAAAILAALPPDWCGHDTLASPEPAPICGAYHPDHPSTRCRRDEGHSGEHATARRDVTWDNAYLSAPEPGPLENDYLDRVDHGEFATLEGASDE